MKKNELFLIITLLLIFISSCDKGKGIGGKILPDSDILGLYICDTVDVLMRTDTITKAKTSNSDYLFLGKDNDPIFGSTEASFMTQFLSSGYTNWGDSAVLDSITLCLPLSIKNNFIGEKLEKPNISVYKLKDTLNKEFTSDQEPYFYADYKKVGTGNISFKYYEGASDSIADTTAIYMRLEDDFGKMFIENSYEYFESNTFTNVFFGLYVKVNNLNGRIYKILSTIKTSSHYGIQIHYHFPGSKDEPKMYLLPFNSSCNRFNMFTHNYVGSTVGTELSKPEGTYSEKVYLQAMAGTKILIDMPTLPSLDSLLINKAELIINIDKSSINKYYPPKSIMLMGLDSTGNYKLLKYFVQSKIYTSFALTEEYQYKIIITKLVQDYIKGYYNKLSLKIFFTSSNAGSDFGRTIINSGTSTTSPSKLVITYTK